MSEAREVAERLTDAVSATHGAPLTLPSGEVVEATGSRVTVRGADIGTVEDGRITQHDVYYDQTELLGQLGLLPA